MIQGIWLILLIAFAYHNFGSASDSMIPPNPEMIAVMTVAGALLLGSLIAPWRAMLRPKAVVCFPEPDACQLAQTLKSADGPQFSRLVAQVYQKLGETIQPAPADPVHTDMDDTSIRFVLSKPEPAAVMCKSWKVSSVTSPEIIEFSTSFKHAGLQHGILVTLRECTAPACSVARKLGIEIVTEAEFVQMLHSAGGETEKELLAGLSGGEKARAA